MSTPHSFLDTVGLERLWAHIISRIQGFVPKTRTINNIPLTEDVTLTASDVGADASGSAASALSNAEAYTDNKIAAEIVSRDAAIDNAKNSAIASAASDATSKANDALEFAKAYTDSAVTDVKDDLLNGAGAAYDTLKELGDLIDENHDAIAALEIVATGKANAVHDHAISEVIDLQSVLDGKQPIGDYAYKSDVASCETKIDASAKLTEAKAYTDSVASGKANSSHGLHVPDCSPSNDGQFLRVVDGTAAWVTILSAEEVKF